jgi:hypothetical protein
MRRVIHASTDQTVLQSMGDRDLARLLALLEADPAGALTIADLRERGLKAPAQAVYELQLAGYEIDRVHFQDPDGRRTPGYCLRGSSASRPDQSTGLREEGDDDT